MRSRAIVRCALFAAFSVTSRAQRTPSGGSFSRTSRRPPRDHLLARPSRRGGRQRTVFAGLAVDCNLNDGGSYDACCDRLAVAERALCFCDGSIVATVEAVIGEAGLDFFRAFAERQCGATLTEASACPSSSPFPSAGIREPVTNAQTPAPPDDDRTPQTSSLPTPLATQQQPTPIPFPIPSPPTPAASTVVPSPSPPLPAAPGVPGFPPEPEPTHPRPPGSRTSRRTQSPRRSSRSLPRRRRPSGHRLAPPTLPRLGERFRASRPPPNSSPGKVG